MSQGLDAVKKRAGGSGGQCPGIKGAGAEATRASAKAGVPERQREQ